MSDLMDKSKTATPSGTRGTPTTPGTDLEWDAMIPSFDEVHNEALKASRYIEDLESKNIVA